MGTWAEDSFGNDTACDWISTFLDEPGLPVVKSAIEAVLDSNDYLEADEACECLAACEVLARLQGYWGVRNSYSKSLDGWIKKNPIKVPSGVKSAAISAIKRILGADSELLELWSENGRNKQWIIAVEDLCARVQGYTSAQ